MFWSVLFIIAGLGLIGSGFIILKKRITSKKEEDIVAYYLDMAYNLPESFYLAVIGLALLIIGIVIAAL